MSLDALAPDQRAVVQLVLQQDRSYEDLAGLLGITTDAVRERAHRGLERLAPAGGVDPGERAEVSDYLLGQQSVSGRGATRSLLSESPAAREWAQAVAGQLASVARSPLPEIPSGAAAPAEPVPEPEPVFEPDPEPITRARPRPRRPEPVEEEPTDVADEPVVRARPRRRSAAVEQDIAAEEAAAKTGTGAATTAALRGDDERPRSSKAGGALLIGGLAILVVALVIWLLNKDDDDEPTSASTGNQPTETATATGTPQFQEVGRLQLTSPSGGDAAAQMAVFASTDRQVAFQLIGENFPPSGEDEAYGVWLVGGSEPHFLGYAPRVTENGELGTSGPRRSDAQNFLQWLTDSRRVVVTLETEENATQPGEIIVSGRIDQTQGGDPSASPEATP